jgi:hypothetical protein
MRITIDLEDLTDEAVGATLSRLATAFGASSLVPSVAPLATPAPRKRPPKQDAAAFTLAAAVEGGMLPSAKAEKQIEQLDLEDAIAATSPELPVEPKPGSPLSRDELLQKLRGVLGKFGAVWFRQNVGEVYKVERLTDLTGEQMAELWTKVQE